MHRRVFVLGESISYDTECTSVAICLMRAFPLKGKGPFLCTGKPERIHPFANRWKSTLISEYLTRYNHCV